MRYPVACTKSASALSMRGGRLFFVVLIALTLPRCSDTGPTAPRGPFQLTILTALGSSSGPVYDGIVYQSYAYDINSAGEIVGKAETPEGGDAFYPSLWPADGGRAIRLEANGNGLGWAYGINGQGQVVGVGSCGGLGMACLWDGQQVTNLGWLDYAVYDGLSQPLAINDSGVAVGWADAAPTGFDHAVIWRNGVATDIGTLGGLQSEALSINNRGLVVGWSRIRRPDSSLALAPHAFLWQNGSMTDLDPGQDEETIAYAINDSGVIVGRLGSTTGNAVIWEKGKMSFLPGAEPSQAFGINNRGEVVGTYIPSGTTFHAALWRDGVRYDLNDVVGDPRLGLHWANAVNDADQIVGFGVWKSDPTREVAFLLTPTGTR